MASPSQFIGQTIASVVGRGKKVLDNFAGD
jgi:hypothetical protein